jgi:PAS domain S-box-containing protein
MDEPALFILTREQLLPRLAQQRKASSIPARIWSIGCQAGDEALLLLLRLHSAQTATKKSLQFSIFATDSDTSAVQKARRLASSDRLQEQESLAPYQPLLEASQNGLTLPRALRQSLIFGMHDLLRQPAFAHLELIVCAASLASLANAQQSELLRRWAFGLAPQGLLLFLAPFAVTPDAELYQRRDGASALLYERTTIPAAPLRTGMAQRLRVSPAKRLTQSEPPVPEEDTAGLIEALQAELEEQLVQNEELTVTLRDTHRAEEAEQRLVAIVSSSGDAILSKDLVGVVTSWNTAAERLYGYQYEEIIGQSVLRLYPPELADEFQQNMARIRQGGRVDPYQTLRLRRDGSRVPVSVSISPIKNRTGAIVGAATIARDISAFYALERQREAFMDIVTHELKSPLTTMLLNLQLAQRRLARLLVSSEGLSEPQRQLGDDVLSLLLRNQQPMRIQQRLIDDLLDFARLRESKLNIHLEDCDLVEAVAQTVQDYQSAHPDRSISLELPEADRISVMADRDRLQQALGNYLTNALKFSPAMEPVWVGIAQETETARVWVQDGGPGLSAEQQALIWDQYYQVPTPTQSGVRPGLGLGLYLSQQLIQQQRGQVGVESQPGHGAKFWFSLPLYHPAAPV